MFPGLIKCLDEGFQSDVFMRSENIGGNKNEGEK